MVCLGFERKVAVEIFQSEEVVIRVDRNFASAISVTKVDVDGSIPYYRCDFELPFFVSADLVSD